MSPMGHVMMMRTLICHQIPNFQRSTREKANAMGISLAEYVRRLIDRDLRTRVLTVGPSQLFDLGASGVSSVARNKKAMLGEARASHHKRALRAK